MNRHVEWAAEWRRIREHDPDSAIAIAIKAFQVPGRTLSELEAQIEILLRVMRVDEYSDMDIERIGVEGIRRSVKAMIKS